MNTLEYIKAKFNVVGDKKVELAASRETDLVNLFRELGFTRGAEIGVESGRYSKVICQANPQLTLLLVDPWKAYRGYRDHVTQEKLDNFMNDAKTRLEGYNVEFHRGFSMDVVKTIEDESLDFVYIDGNHDFQNVTNDIVEWSKKVRPGGIIAGHDYRRTKGGAVNDTVDVVNAYTYAKGIRPWFVLIADRASSWMWVK